MSTGPVARWLDTFVFNSKQYAEIFKKFGFDTLNEVCKLDHVQLSKMGVNPIDSEKIMENVAVLRQTLQVSNINTSPSTPTPTTNQKPPRKTKAKASKQQAAPNVTINQVNSNGMPMNSMPVNRQSSGNPDAARKIGSEILQMANTNQTNTKYTCIPVNQNYNYPNQYNTQYNNNQYSYNQQFRQINQNYNQNYNGYYNNWNQQQQPHDYYQNQYYQQNQYQQQQQQQTHSNEFYTQNYKQNNNSPLEYLERLVQQPESNPVIDPKSVVNNEVISDANFEDINKNNKRINSDNFTDNSKKVCSTSSSNSNSPNFKLNQNKYLNISSDSPSSSSSCSSSSSMQQPLLNNHTDLGSANLIDTCNFDFLDYLPELNSNTIDQTITSSTTTTSSESVTSQLDNLLSPEQISQTFQFNNFQ
ncbi:unnamed protein product [Brachionus calyciflorus]|uniref:SAM domain-containing protein n=1 Tax=Brachionus calyciflorus TaxID=104777 RepID=A0A814I9N7_9BILA|nr:unnamed protein product [Brachionus calyciflorus]